MGSGGGNSILEDIGLAVAAPAVGLGTATAELGTSIFGERTEFNPVTGARQLLEPIDEGVAPQGDPLQAVVEPPEAENVLRQRAARKAALESPGRRQTILTSRSGRSGSTGAGSLITGA